MYSNTIIPGGVERGFSRVWTGDRGFNVRLFQVVSGGFRFKNQNPSFPANPANPANPDSDISGGFNSIHQITKFFQDPC